MASNADHEKISENDHRKWHHARLFLLSFIPTVCLFFFLTRLFDLRITLAAAVSAFAAVILLAIEHLLPANISNIKFLRAVIIIICSSLLATYLFGMNLWAEFGPIDDHEIMVFLGTDGKTTFAEAPEILMSETEVGKLGNSPRYRPTYYVLRLAEAVLWGNDPSLWYLSRLIMVIIAISISWHILSKIVGFLPAGFMIGLIFLWPSWGDIFSRLGPAETYAVVGLAFFALGANLLLSAPNHNPSNASTYGGWILIFCGYLLAVGSKENFLILLPIVLLFFAFALKQRQTPRFAALSTVLMLTFAALIVFAVFSATASFNTDIYDQSTGLFQRIDAIWDMVFVLISALFLIPTIILLAILIWSYHVQAGRRLRRPTAIALIIVAGSYFLLFFSQYFFYAGRWPTKIRYDFPGMLFVPIVVLTLLCYGIVLLRYLGIGPAVEKGLRAGLIVGAALLLGLLTYANVRDLGFRNLRRTQEFTQQLNRVTTTLQQNPASALVIESHKVRDYETIFSWARYLQHAQGIENPIFLRTYGYTTETGEVPNVERLALRLEQASVNGERGFSPQRELETYKGNCFSLQLSGHTNTNCQDIK